MTLFQMLFLQVEQLSPAFFIIGSLLTYGIYRYFLYPLYLSPLARIPGPRLSALSRLNLDGRYYLETGIPWIEQLHQQYGPVVRVGPSEIVTNDPDHFSMIYGIQSIFPRPETAVLFQNHQSPNVFSSRHRDEHRQRRRRVARVYAMTTSLNDEQLVAWMRNQLDRIHEFIAQKGVQPLDIYSLATDYALDVVSAVVYGKSLDLLGGHNLRAKECIRHFDIATVPLVRFSGMIDFMSRWPLSTLMPRFLRDALRSNGVLESLNLQQIDQMSCTDNAEHAEHSILATLKNHSEYGQGLTDGDIASECLDHTVGGTGSTAAAIAYLFYTIAKPEYITYQTKLRKEVATISPFLSPRDVCDLPVLDSCVHEILRLFPPSPGTIQQRVVVDKDCELVTLTVGGQEYQLPRGTMISAQAWSVHRNERIFSPDSDRFRPERWENEDEEQLQRMRRAWIPFGTGARTCLGMGVAMIEIKMIVAAMLQRYRVELPDGADPSEMYPKFGAVLRPAWERCMLIFRALKE
ncbi:hypothetical protein BBP40_010147 [Aspergillus hancockii]|nr:hypothetical protein BBP40_010147 [Aspergillus hancockii]